MAPRNCSHPSRNMERQPLTPPKRTVSWTTPYFYPHELELKDAALKVFTYVPYTFNPELTKRAVTHSDL